MMVGGRMTPIHLGMLVKIARGCTEEEFVTHFEACTFPKVKFSGPEAALKEACYGVFAEACVKLGLLSQAQKAA